MNFKLLICNNCDNEKEDSILFFESNNFSPFYKPNKEEINIKSILSTSDNNNNSINNNLEIIEYPYKFSCDENNNEIPEPIPSLIKRNNIIKKKFKKEDYFIDVKKQTKLYDKTIDEFKDIKGPIEQKDYFFSNNNNNEDESNDSSSLINNEDSLICNKVLLTNYYSNCHSTINNNVTVNDNNYDSNNIKIEDINNEEKNNNKIIIHNLIGYKVDYSDPDTDSFFTKTNNLFNVNCPKNKNKTKENIIDIKTNKKLQKEYKSKKFSKNNSNYHQYSKKRIKKRNSKNYSDFELLMNNQKITIFNSKKSLNENEKIKKNILKVSTKTIKIKKKLINFKESLNNKNIISYRTLQNNSSNKNNILIKTTNIKNNLNSISKHRKRFLSHNYFDQLLLNMSNSRNMKRNTYSNFNDKKKSLKNKELWNIKNQNNYSYRIYNNPFVNLKN